MGDLAIPCPSTPSLNGRLAGGAISADTALLRRAFGGSTLRPDYVHRVLSPRGVLPAALTSFTLNRPARTAKAEFSLMGRVKFIFAPLMGAAISLAVVGAASASANLIQNGSFETVGNTFFGTDGVADWKISGMVGDGY